MNIEEIIIRDAVFADIADVAIIHIDSWCRTYKGIIDQDYLDEMKENLPKRVARMKKEFTLRKMLVATIDKKIVAFTEYSLTNEFSKDLDIDCELCGLYVKNEYLNKGIGTKLFNYVKDTFIKEGKKQMGIWCLKDNKNAINFYKSKGGVITKEKFFTLKNHNYQEVAFIYNLNGEK